MDSAHIEGLIRAALPDADVTAVDLQGGDHFEVTVVSDRFVGLPLVQQHRMIYAALGDSMRQEIHALAIRTMTPGQLREELAANPDRTS